MRIPLAVYCVIRRVRPTNSKFHPRSGFIPTKADLVKKDCNFVSKLQSFFVSNPKFLYHFTMGAKFRVMGAFFYKGLHLFGLDKLEVFIITRKRKIDSLIRYSNLMS